MYAALWRVLPGSTALKILQCLVLALAIVRFVKALLSLLLFAVVVMVLFVWVFPWASPLLPFNDVTVTPDGAPGQ